MVPDEAVCDEVSAPRRIARRSRRRPGLSTAALVAIAVAAVVAARGSLINPLANAVVELAGALLLGVAAGLRRPGRARRLAALAGGAAAIDLATITIVRRGFRITDHLPPSFWVWAAAVGGALALAVVPRATGRRVGAAVLAPLVLASGAFLQVNAHYSYFPSVAALAGRGSVPAVDQRVLAQLSPRAGPPPSRMPATGVLVPLDVPATVSQLTHRPGEVWLPPAWFGPDRARLPVVVMLGGTPGSPVAWDRAGLAARTAATYAEQHGGVAPVLIFTDQNGSASRDTECVDGPVGRADTFLAVDVPAFARDQLGLSPNPRRWAVVGFSEGGTCAIVVALRHPDVYGSFVDLAGDASPNLGSPSQTRDVLFGGDANAAKAYDPTRLLRQRAYGETTGWFSAGAADRRAQRIMATLAPEAAAAGVRCRAFVGVGGHDWTFARRSFADVFPALADVLLSPPGPTRPKPMPTQGGPASAGSPGPTKGSCVAHVSRERGWTRPTS